MMKQMVKIRLFDTRKKLSFMIRKTFIMSAYWYQSLIAAAEDAETGELPL